MQDGPIQRRDGGFYFPDSRIGLDNLVYLWREGLSSQAMQEAYPSLSLQQIATAIDFYLANRPEVDAWITECEREEEESPFALSKTRLELFRRLELARRELFPKG